MQKILITGSCGQIGTELAIALSEIHGAENVVASDLKDAHPVHTGPFETLNVCDKDALHTILKKHGITQVYHLAALLSGTGEKNPKLAWDVNMNGLILMLDAAVEFGFKLYWPSSIAVFGPTTPKQNTPQKTVMEPSTIYGITKLSGELLCEYYKQKRNVDVRCLRYPGLISYKAHAGGGTTDYAVDIYFEAKQKGRYECFLNEHTMLPMMYMPDAIRATIQLMEAPKEKIKTSGAYNLAAMSFTPAQIAEEIQKHIPLSIFYKEDFRQAIANSWPQTIDDSAARSDWGWQHEYDLARMTTDMLRNI